MDLFTTPDWLQCPTRQTRSALATASGAWRAVSRALARIPKQEADQAREAQLARLQAVRIADIVGFGNVGVRTALSTANGGFGQVRLAAPDFGYWARSW